MVIVRRYGFSNDQWPLAGTSLLRVRPNRMGRYAFDSSQKVRPAACANEDAWPIETSLRGLPRDQFDYLWLIDPPPYDSRLIAGYRLVWRGDGSVLYVVGKFGDKESQ
jgi:hypothetical protein